MNSFLCFSSKRNNKNERNPTCDSLYSNNNNNNNYKVVKYSPLYVVANAQAIHLMT